MTEPQRDGVPTWQIGAYSIAAIAKNLASKFSKRFLGVEKMFVGFDALLAKRRSGGVQPPRQTRRFAVPLLGGGNF